MNLFSNEGGCCSYGNRRRDDLHYIFSCKVKSKPKLLLLIQWFYKRLEETQSGIRGIYIPSWQPELHWHLLSSLDDVINFFPLFFFGLSNMHRYTSLSMSNAHINSSPAFLIIINFIHLRALQIEINKPTFLWNYVSPQKNVTRYNLFQRMVAMYSSMLLPSSTEEKKQTKRLLW